jgi:DNA-directed RNA polymerase subunit beta
MAGTIQCGRRSRKDFGKIPSIVEIPNLIEVQRRSYETFLQKDVPADRREDLGLQGVFKSVFPSRTTTTTRCWSSIRTTSASRSTRSRSVTTGV